MKLRHSEKDYPDDDFVPPELRAQSYAPADIEAPEMLPDGEIAGLDEAPVAAAPSPQAQPSREDMLRKVFEAQQKHDSERASRLSDAARMDRKKQSQANVREYLRAAFTRGNPQLRNLGNSYSQEAASVGNDGPLSRELALQKVLSAYQTKPEDSELRDAKLKMYLEQAGMYGRANQPKPEKVIKAEDSDDLSPEEEVFLEKRLGLPPGSLANVRRKTVGLVPKKTGSGQKAQAKEDGEIEKQAERLAKELGGDPAKIKAKLDRLDAEAASKKDLPGVGSIEGRAPDLFTSSKGVEIRNEAKSLVNALLFLQSGAGVSNQEREQQYALYGIEGGDERAFRDGLKRLRRDIAAEVRAKSAGVRPEAVKRYRERGGTTADDIEPPEQPSTVTIREKKTGQTVVVPAAELKDWQAEDDWSNYEVVP